MSQDLWTNVDDYINSITVGTDAALDAAAASAAAAKLPPISVTPAHGKLLHLMVRAQGAKRILEVGTLAGYSTIWLARAVPPAGRVITLEANATHADIARANVERAGLSGRIEIRLGNALDTLPQLAAEKQPPFDFTFIDADRPNLAEYFDWAVRLSHPGSVIVVDNVVRKGGVIDASSDDPNIKGVRRFNDRLKDDTRVSATMVQTVSAKGYDGFAMALVL
ncbi:MAG TPA: O-methyltransferase [Vicinamibacterales bacterium]|nr:O-methyltransferase [Vicinamibacterales bacterium]